jgi:hypothetical protein
VNDQAKFKNVLAADCKREGCRSNRREQWSFLLMKSAALPMNLSGGSCLMQVTITVSDEIVREAKSRSLFLTDFVEMLLDKGLEVVMDRPVLNSAIDLIRNLRSASPLSNR